MAQESFAQLWRAVRLYSPVLPATLAQQFIISRFRDLRRKRLWSWRIGQSQILIPPAIVSGQATATYNSQTVTGVGTGWTTDIVGRQFRVGARAPVYTIVRLNSATSLELDQPWGGLTVTGAYQIFQAYVLPTPTDFQDFLSVRDVYMNWQLNLHVPQDYIDQVDAQRSATGNAYCLADFKYNQTDVGTGSVGPCTRVVGSGPGPFASGLYSGYTQSLYVITITTGGVVGTAEFTWRKDGGSSSAPMLTTEQPFEMDEGVLIQFPADTYILDDVFVIAVTPGFASSGPMFEMWPYQMNQRPYPYLYDRRFPDPNTPGWALPPFIDGDILVKGALADLYRWPGTEDRKNPGYNLNTALSFEQEFQGKVAEMEREDDEVYSISTRYQMGLPFATLDAMGANWRQTHDVGPLIY